MKLVLSLGVFGPWQIIAIIVAFGLVIGASLLLVFLIGRRSAKKSTYRNEFRSFGQARTAQLAS